MHLWVEIVGRELIMLITLVLLGAGPAAFLGKRFDPAARIAITPVLGLCLGTSVFTTLIWLLPARDTYWLLPLLAAASVFLALTRARAAAPILATSWGGALRALWCPRARDAFALAGVCVVVAAPFSYTLHERDSVGPTGFVVYDSVGYVGETDGMAQQSIRQASHAEPEGANFVRQFWTMYSQTDVNLDASPLSANLNELSGWGSTDTQTLFLIVFLVGDALGTFAAVRYLAAKPFWIAPLAGLMFAGPFHLQLMADGSQAAICGTSVILPLVAVSIEALRERRLAHLVLVAILGSGLLAIYPPIAPGVAIAAGLILLAFAGLRWRRGRLNRQALGEALAQSVAVLAMSILFDIVAFTHAISYWGTVLTGADTAGKPKYELPVSVLPGWLLQTRQFFFLKNLSHASLHVLLLGGLLPAIFIAAMLIGLRRRPVALIFLPIIFVFAALAIYSRYKYNCSYCVDRNMIPIAPVVYGLLALGVAALATMTSRSMRWLGMAVAAAALIAAGAQLRSERVIFANDSYFLDAGTRALVNDLPAHAGPLDLEGYGQDPHHSAGELPMTYYLAYERNHAEVSVASEYTDYNALFAFGGPKPHNPNFDPEYRYVLTRFGGVSTGRRVIARVGSLALEERTAPLDATLISGVALPAIRLDSNGYGPVVGQLHFLVGGNGTAPAWVLLHFQTIEPATAAPQPGVTSQSTPHLLTVCVPVTGTAPVRQAALTLQGHLFAGAIPNEQFPQQGPPQGINLVGMRAVPHCSPDEPG